MQINSALPTSDPQISTLDKRKTQIPLESTAYRKLAAKMIVVKLKYDKKCMDLPEVKQFLIKEECIINI